MTMSVGSSEIIIIIKGRLTAMLMLAFIVITSITIVCQIHSTPRIMITNMMIQQASAMTSSSSSSVFSYYYSPYHYHYSESPDTIGNSSPVYFTKGTSDYSISSSSSSSSSRLHLATTTTTNQKPVAIAMAFPQTAQEGSLITLDGTKSHIADGSGMYYYSWAQVAGPYVGPLSPNAISTFRAPHVDYYTQLQFQLNVQDKLGASSSSYVTIALTTDDHPPIAYSQSIQTTQNTPVGIEFKATDPDPGDTVGYAIVSQPSHGLLSSINSALIGTSYTPNNGFSGTDSFSIQAFDRNRLVSNVATIYITVTKVNHPPIAYSQSIQTTQNTPVGIHLSAVDSDPGDIITSFAIISMPARGTITNFDQSSGTLTYTPYAGVGTVTDSFTFDVIDNHGLVSKPGVISITINPVAR